MKNQKTIYWIATGIIVVFEGIMPALTGNSEMARAGMAHLGYPEYFAMMLATFKVLGVLAIAIPLVPKTLREWAYGCFVVELLFATGSHATVDGWANGQTYFPLVILAVLLTSYFTRKAAYPAAGTAE
jgi:uncharacterized membrane protein YphA (DoxX/SURF4 family)